MLNWALEGFDRLMKNDKLSFLYNNIEVEDLYERNSDSGFSLQVDGDNNKLIRFDKKRAKWILGH